MACEQQGPRTILIQPYGSANLTAIEAIKEVLENTYGSEVVVNPSLHIPRSAFVKIKTPRHRADTLIAQLKRNKPEGVDFVLGLTNKDISTTKYANFGMVKEPKSKYIDWGIFGLGYRPGPSSIVSTFRLQHKDKALFLSRLKKVCLHEVGHNMGLKHCKSNEVCVMRDAAETIRTIDRVGERLCLHCQSKIGI